MIVIESDEIPDNAQQKFDACIQANPWMDPEVIEKIIERIASENASTRSKLGKLIQLADATIEALKPYVACSLGCAHCCRVPALIYEREAIRMSKASGRMMVRMPYRTHEEVLSASTKFRGQPCSFLIDEKCSIYNDRPLVCRVHHSLSSDKSLCQSHLQQEPVKVIQYNPDIIEVPYHHIVLTGNAREPWGNILEFFPAP